MTVRRSILLLFLFGLAPGIAGAQTKINGCTAISSPGPYVLSKNITASASDLVPGGPFGSTACILITADFVTLDLAGFTISGPSGAFVFGGPFTFGVTTDTSHTAITVMNGAVTNFQDGVSLEGFGHTVDHIRAIHNVRGINVFSSSVSGSSARIIGNIAFNNGAGAGSSGFGIHVSCPAVVLENMATANSTDILETGTGVCTNMENNPITPIIL